MRRGVLIFLLLILCVPGSSQGELAGAAKIRISLEKLLRLGTLLHVGAHPDDENTALLALSARGWKYRTAYLSLTRGEGGQNLIGSEQGVQLGVIRTQELLAARKLDGAEQAFARAIDFGFSKTADETLSKWDRRLVLGDIVYAIRRLQPDVVVLRFSGTPRDGHGQHQASAILAREAFIAAGDPAQFPEQLGSVAPWKATRLFLNVPAFTPRMEKEAQALPEKLTIDVGVYDPVLGHAFGEIAGMSRSQHRSQAMGVPQERGRMREYFVLLSGPRASTDLFEGIDTTWGRVGGSQRARELLETALRTLDDREPAKVVPLLLRARQEIRMLEGPWAARKLAELENAIAECAGLFLDASASKPYAVTGSKAAVRFQAVNRSSVPVKLNRITAGPATITPAVTLIPGVAHTEIAEVTMPEGVTQPYWLWRTPKESMYEIGDVRALDTPDGPVALHARFDVEIAGEPFVLMRPVQQRYVDPSYGERTRPLVAVPPATLAFAEPTLVFPNASARDIAVQVTALTGNVAGNVRLRVPNGWSVEPPLRDFEMKSDGEQTSLSFRVTPPAEERVDRMQAVAVIGGKEYPLARSVIDYPHIETQAIFTPAEVRLVRADVQVLSKRIGYVMGSGDDIPRALEQIGCQVTLLDGAELANGNLRRYDAIITGVRAFNTRADLRANVQRLFDYANAGGTLVVQYNVLGAGLDRFAPYDITIGRERITVEDSPVRFDEMHPVFRKPNAISSKDFEGWVQERGLYFASKWDPMYTPLLRMQDPGEEPLEGATLLVRYGRGVYVFTPLSWFRQLPAGVPGAYRMFANLISMGKAEQ
jgi:LmbE family N-acetylglucosaminyl deacetylase